MGNLSCGRHQWTCAHAHTHASILYAHTHTHTLHTHTTHTHIANTHTCKHTVHTHTQCTDTYYTHTHTLQTHTHANMHECIHTHTHTHALSLSLHTCTYLISLLQTFVELMDSVVGLLLPHEARRRPPVIGREWRSEERFRPRPPMGWGVSRGHTVHHRHTVHGVHIVHFDVGLTRCYGNLYKSIDLRTVQIHRLRIDSGRP